MPMRKSMASTIADVQEGNPLMWAVFCPPGHEFDWLTFTEKIDAINQAHEFEDESDDPNDKWQIYPLFAGTPIDA